MFYIRQQTRLEQARSRKGARRDAAVRHARKAFYLAFIFCLSTIMVPATALAQGHGAPQAMKGTDSGTPKALQSVGIDQRLNEQLPLDAVFKDELGRDVPLGTYFGERPVILALVYYECPMLCNQVLNGLLSSLSVLKYDAGKDFDVVAISFDPRENEKPGLAAEKKQSFIERYNRPGATTGWHLLTGNEDSIKRVTEAAGFRYAWDEQTNQFAHASAIMIATPEGKLARYFYGIEYAPVDVKLGLVEASENKIGSPIDSLLLYCYHYDPSAGTYRSKITMGIVRLGGVLFLVGLALFYFVMIRRRKMRSGRMTEAGGTA